MYSQPLSRGVAFVAQSEGMKYVGPNTFNCARMLIGGVMLIPCIFLLDKMKEKSTGKKKRWMPKAKR